MQEETLSPAAISAISLAVALSLSAAFYVLQRYQRGLPLLEYEPRRRVPWGPLVVTIPLFFVAVNSTPLLVDSGSTTAEEPNSSDFVVGGLITSLFLITFVIGAVAWLLAEGKADWGDLGLPKDRSQLWRDVNIGFVACLFALLPIYVLNFALMMAFESKQQHPLIENLLKNHSLLLMLSALLSAVVAAPLFEEFTFRVLLQGWLEKLEDERLDYAATLRTPVEIADGDQLEIDATAFTADEPRPNHGWISVLPHGWTPILISAFIFGLAHVGHGVAPIPLVFLGVVLGYLYQRTHRIVPSIAAHALFNAYSLLLLWLQLQQG